jgi:hypothetical protein
VVLGLLYLPPVIAAILVSNAKVWAAAALLVGGLMFRLRDP